MTTGLLMAPCYLIQRQWTSLGCVRTEQLPVWVMDSPSEASSDKLSHPFHNKTGKKKKRRKNWGNLRRRRQTSDNCSRRVLSRGGTLRTSRFDSVQSTTMQTIDALMAQSSATSIISSWLRVFWHFIHQTINWLVAALIYSTGYNRLLKTTHTFNIHPLSVIWLKALW